MTNRIISKLVFAILACLAFQTTAIASDEHELGRNSNSCDVVALNGTGTLLEDGRIVGAEILSLIGTEKQIAVEFSMVTLGTIEVDQTTGGVTLATSHDFTSVKNQSINFTTFDEITVIPLGGTDATCVQNACGLIFKLQLETGDGRYNCGEIISGYNPDPTAPIPFASFVDPLNPAPNGDTLFLNSLGKLCKCSGNN